MNKKIFKYLAGVFALLVFLIPTTIFALGLKTGENVNLSDKTVEDNQYIFATQVELSEIKIKGDLYIFASDISIEKVEVEGDVVIVGANLDIDGLVCEDLKIGGAQLLLRNSQISGELLGAGSIFTIKNSTVAENVYVGANQVNFTGEIGEKLKLAADRVRINGIVHDDVFVRATSLVVGSKTVIDGKLTNRYSDTKARISDQAKISGDISQSKVLRKAVARNAALQVKVTSTLLSLIAYLVVGLLLVLLFPRCAPKTAELISKKPWPTLGFGLLFLFVLPLVLFILIFTLIGIPISIIGFGVYALAIYIAKLFAGIWIGQQILKKAVLIWQMTLGVVILAIAGFIPVIGGLVGFLALIFGLGALSLRSFELMNELRKKKLV